VDLHEVARKLGVEANIQTRSRQTGRRHTRHTSTHGGIIRAGATERRIEVAAKIGLRGQSEGSPANESRPSRMLFISPRYGTITLTNTPSENMVARPYPD
jgi:hypothetical protein